jgi:polyphosphate kinase 2 (PPK2 family)
MLESVDLTLSMDKGIYEIELISNQVALSKLAFQVYQNKRPVMMVFEGWDAAGKGGVIKRLTEKMDPRGYVVYPIAAPQGDDKTHHYMWRFWRRLPETGQIAIFDRSWYGRVMVERIEGFCNEVEWMRAYREINQFERQLIDFGTILLKFWVHISKEEQLKRFQDRSGDKLRSWKLTDEDWRNREKWDLYKSAVNDMLLKTSTIHAPWTVIEGNSKYYARIKVLQTVVKKLGEELEFDPFLEDKKPDNDQKKKKPKKI